VRVRSDAENEMVADLVVGFKGIHENFTSRVTKQRPERIRVDYVEGPLKYLYNDWIFRPDGQGGCLVDFTVDFAFRSRIFEALAGQVFDRALRKMIGAFEQRAAALYGPVESGISSSSAKSAA
jgi:coenzyme Q-binding protein COQ10